ncbi:hypothetical protein EHRUM2_05750, partial [Ehrlichia ruminantium]
FIGHILGRYVLKNEASIVFCIL